MIRPILLLLSIHHCFGRYEIPIDTFIHYQFNAVTLCDGELLVTNPRNASMDDMFSYFKRYECVVDVTDTITNHTERFTTLPTFMRGFKRIIQADNRVCSIEEATATCPMRPIASEQAYTSRFSQPSWGIFTCLVSATIALFMDRYNEQSLILRQLALTWAANGIYILLTGSISTVVTFSLSFITSHVIPDRWLMPPPLPLPPPPPLLPQHLPLLPFKSSRMHVGG